MGFCKNTNFFVYLQANNSLFLTSNAAFLPFLRFAPPAVYNVHTYVTDLERYRYKEGRFLQQKNFSATEHVKEKRIYSR